ncbi:MAG: signal peptide peptidase SppA [Bdellovibrionota bacterium]
METIKKFLKYLLGMFAVLIAFSFAAALCVGMVIVSLRQGASDDELGSTAVKTEHAVGVVEITGEIMTSEKFEKSLKTALDNPKLKAVVVRIDSPGGAVGASEEMYRAIKTANEKTPLKPVVCSLGTVAASGGLFAAAGCKKIVANESTLTGSIGVIMMSPNVKGLLDKFGVQMMIVKSGKLKDTGSPFRETNQEDREYLQQLIDHTYGQFVKVVSQSRGIPVEQVKKFADGRIILGDQAKELGLIDEIGGINEAAKIALQLIGDSAEPEIIKPTKGPGLLSMFAEVPDSSIWYWLKGLGKTQLLYRSFL